MKKIKMEILVDGDMKEALETKEYLLDKLSQLDIQVSAASLIYDTK